MTAEHVVLPDDEARHTPDGEDLWNESYYCDFVRSDGSLGGWLRLGLYPNRQVAWWTTWIVWPDRPGICSADYRAPVPPGDGLVSEASIGPDNTADQRIEIDVALPLESFRLAASAPAHIIDRPEDVYTSGEQIGPAERLDLDLTWTTDGVPYHYDLTTRYEIPCLVYDHGRVPDELFAELQRHLNEVAILELTYITTLYFQHAVMSKALRTEFDDRDDPIVEVPGPVGATAMRPGPGR